MPLVSYGSILHEPITIRKGVFPSESWDLNKWKKFVVGNVTTEILNGVLKITVPGILNNRISMQWGNATGTDLFAQFSWETRYVEFGMKVRRTNNVCDTAFALEEETTAGAGWNTVSNPFGLACPAPTDNVHWFVKKDNIPSSFGSIVSTFVSDNTWQSFRLILEPKRGKVELFKDDVSQGTMNAISTFPRIPLSLTIALTMVGGTQNTTEIEYFYLLQEND